MSLFVLSQLALAFALPAAPPAAGSGTTKLVGAPPPPAEKFDIEPFRFLIGRWRGAGTFGPTGDPVTSTMTFALANRTTMLVQAAEDPPNPYRYVATWSKEKETGDLLMLLSSSLDGPAIFRSRGWVGGRMVFEPKAGVRTGPSSVRFTYVKTGERNFDLTYEFSANGAWHLGDKQRFTKVE